MKPYGFSIAIAALATAICFAMFPYFELTNLVMVYLLGTMIVATRGRKGPAALSAVSNVLCFDFFFVPPRFTFSVADAQYLLTFAVMFAVAMFISHLTIRLQSEAKAARESETHTRLMHEFAQSLAGTRGAGAVVTAAARYLDKTFDGFVTTFILGEANRVEAAGGTDARTSNKETAVAQWVFEKGEPAGLGEKSLSADPALYVPLRGASGVAGVLRLEPRSGQALSAGERQLLDSFGHQIALAIERDQLEAQAEQAKVDAQAERLRSALLSSVSHDFRTPLTAIVGSASVLLGRDEIKRNPKAAELVETIQNEGDRLARQIQNLLETTRLESGVRIKKELFPLEEIVGTSLERLSKLLGKRRITVRVDGLPPLPMDGLLMEQVFVNLLENAARHTPPGTEISIDAKTEGGFAIVSVSDRGPGLKSDETERVFDKFYHDERSPGAGLGLAICRAIVNAHGGRIWAENRAEGGAVFQFTIPLEKPVGN